MKIHFVKVAVSILLSIPLSAGSCWPSQVARSVSIRHRCGS